MDFAPPSVRDAFARLRSMASSGSNNDEEKEASVLLLPDSTSATSSATIATASSSAAGGGGGAQLRGGAGGQQSQQQLHGTTNKGGGLLSSAFPASPPPPLPLLPSQEKPSPSSFLPPPMSSPARLTSSSSFSASVLASSAVAFFGKPFSSSTSNSNPRRRQAKLSSSSSHFAPSSPSSFVLLFSRDSVVTILVVAAWYAANTGILLMNRALLSNFGFKRPLLLTLLHMSACALLGKICKPWEESIEKKSKSSSSSLAVRVSDKESSANASSPSPFSNAAAAAAGPANSKVAVLAATFCAAVVLGNVSLRFIPVSFAQAIGSTTPAFTAALAFVLLGAREPLSVYATLLPVVGGVVLATGFEPSFDAFGFGTAVAATAARSLKAVLQGALLTDPSRDRVGSMALLRLMAPIAAAMLLPATIFLEPGGLAATAAACRRSTGFALFLFANAALSYVVNLTNFVVTKRTSPLTLHVLGNAKGVFATVVSVAVFQNPVSSVGAAGYLSAVAGTLLYGFLKSKNRRTTWSGKEEQESTAAAASAKISIAAGDASSAHVDGAITIKAVAA